MNNQDYNNQVSKDITLVMIELAKSKARIKQLEEALKFYSTADSFYIEDAGKMAREVLKRVEQ